MENSQSNIANKAISRLKQKETYEESRTKFKHNVHWTLDGKHDHTKMNYPEYWRRPVYGSRQEMLFELIHHIYYNMDIKDAIKDAIKDKA